MISGGFPGMSPMIYRHFQTHKLSAAPEQVATKDSTRLNFGNQNPGLKKVGSLLCLSSLQTEVSIVGHTSAPTDSSR